MAVASEASRFRVYGRSRRARRRTRATIVTAAALVAAMTANAVHIQGLVAPGVSVSGVDVGGLSRSEAQERIARVLGTRLTRPILVVTPAGSVRVSPAQAGVRINVVAAVNAAVRANRIGGALLPYLVSDSIRAPLFEPSAPQLPAPVAVLGVAPIDARLVLAANGQATVTAGQLGLRADPRVLIGALARAALDGRGVIRAGFVPTPPAITTLDAQRTAARSASLLSAPVRLVFHRVLVGVLEPRTLAPLLRVRQVRGVLALTVDPAGLAAQLGSVAARVATPAKDATFALSGQFARVVPARNGQALNVAATGRSIVGAAMTHTAKVRVSAIPPSLSTLAAHRLGIHHALFASPITTDMGASSYNRVWNVHLLARILNDTIIRPGQTFDFNTVAGPRTAARGFLVGQEISNGQVIPAIGGGTCQVATTLFDAAFFAGLKVTARTNHSFYLSHYPMGLDATVSWGGPELRFVNTLPRAILIHFTYTDQTLSVQFYSTRLGITVSERTGAQYNFTSPGTQVVPDPTLPAGSRVVVGGGFGGFTVVVNRTVRQHGRVIRQDSFTSVYTPEDTVIHVGPPKPTTPKPAAGPPPTTATAPTTTTNPPTTT